ncbi:MAG TPA: amidohydrolase family protein [Dehalococcoidales bacterium]
MKIIDTEAHFYTQEYQDYLLLRKEIPREENYKGYVRLWYGENTWEPHGLEVEDRLLEIADGRLKNMDKAGIDMQVLSLSTPGCEQFSAADGTVFALKTNNALSQAIEKHPDRFCGLAALAPQDPEQAARELERAVKELGLKGAKINARVGNSHLDEKRFWPVFETAEKLDVPIFLHPNSPSPDSLKAYSDYGFSLAGPAWGFGAETALAVMRLIYSGVFDRYPKLKIVLGHLGEGLVFWIYRIDFSFKKPWMEAADRPAIKKAPSEYLRNSFYVNNAGMYAVPAFLSVLLELGADHMMFAADYPYENSEEAANFIRKVPISDPDKEKILHTTAEKLFKLK